MAASELKTIQFRALVAELAHAEQRERRRIAHILHDHVQQLLYAAKIHLGILQGNAKTKRSSRSIGEVVELLDESLTALRSLTVELSPPVLYEAGLMPALDWLARRTHQKYGLTVEVKCEEGTESVAFVAEDVCVLLFEAVRELLFNIVKHARADSACVRAVPCEEGFVRIVVTDMGVGFDPTIPKTDSEPSSGFGLASIRRRLEALGGCLEVESAPMWGTSITLMAPISVTPPAGSVA